MITKRQQILNSINNRLYAYNWALNKETGEVVCCDGISCRQCQFFDEHKNFISCRTARSAYLDKLEDGVCE